MSGASQAKDHAGARVGFWTVSHRAPSFPGRGARWHCVCDCGTEKILTADTITKGKSKSCGCQTMALRSASLTTHGQSGGKSRKQSGAYKSWHAMRQRCDNENGNQYADYGGRGIRVCDAWETFAGFYADMGDRQRGMTLDRYPDVNGNYEPGNCRWATMAQQAETKRPRVKNGHLISILAAAKAVVAANDNDLPQAITSLSQAITALEGRSQT